MAVRLLRTPETAGALVCTQSAASLQGCRRASSVAPAETVAEAVIGQGLRRDQLFVHLANRAVDPVKRNVEFSQERGGGPGGFLEIEGLLGLDDFVVRNHRGCGA